MNNLADVVRSIRRRPQMFFGDQKISTLFHFLNGYRFAVSIHQCEKAETVTKNFTELHFFTARRLGVKANGLSWATLLTNHCDGDEGKAMELFFEISEEFIIAQTQP